MVTWWKGLPSSSSHALVGGLAISPVIGFGGAWLMERGALRGLRRATVHMNWPVLRAQWVTSGWLGLSHGANDAQKAVGVLAVCCSPTGRRPGCRRRCGRPWPAPPPSPCGLVLGRRGGVGRRRCRRRELYRRFSRISETLTEAADRIWYATVKEG